MNKGEVVASHVIDDDMLAVISDGGEGGCVIFSYADYMYEQVLEVKSHYQRKHCRHYPTLAEATSVYREIVSICDKGRQLTDEEQEQYFKKFDEIFDQTKIDWTWK